MTRRGGQPASGLLADAPTMPDWQAKRRGGVTSTMAFPPAQDPANNSDAPQVSPERPALSDARAVWRT
ncbi:hypothetical protein Arub01_16510 [Actinomadura rubrobrunea]|uniref:Uncharacterized protein n=1 Tax=Actinomadura rubrobrunea TaxID=115335 RepID=A0A9W6UVM7_9ACTN|nr:hypothetical protein Arub01_16510 [Actinomadura rubrobrunea]